MSEEGKMVLGALVIVSTVIWIGGLFGTAWFAWNGDLPRAGACALAAYIAAKHAL